MQQSHYSVDNGWVQMSDIIKYLKNSDLNIRNYEEAVESIHSGWLEFKELDNNKFVKINRVLL